MANEIGYLEYRGLLGRETQPMSREETQMFLGLFALDKDHPEKDYGDIPSTFYKILRSRLDAQNGCASEATLVFLSSLDTSNTPGGAVMWAYTLWTINQEGVPKVTVETLAEYFPDGFPTKAAHSKAWDEQKKTPPYTGSDNWLDSPVWKDVFDPSPRGISTSES